MNNGIKNVLIFAVGAAIGSAVTWKIVKTKYEQIAQEEIDSVKDAFAQRVAKVFGDDSDKKTNKPSIDEVAKNLYSEVLHREGYSNYSNGKKEEEPDMDKDRPYIIPPDEFGNYGEYDTIGLVYYADGVVEDEWGEVMGEDDFDEVVGKDSIEHFGEYEEDSVFVRNDALKIDYEILRDNKNYHDSEEE